MANTTMDTPGVTGTATRLTALLSAEHRVIEQVLDALDILAARARKAGRLDGRSALEVLDLVREFADRWHHGKEEALLFPAMVKRGIGAHTGPIAVMMAEHGEGRRMVKAMKDTSTAAVNGKPEAVEEFAAAAGEYTTLLRAHILKEDRILYPMADQVLTEEDQAALNTDAREVEKKLAPHGPQETYERKAARLAARLGVKTVVRGKCSCCG